MKIELSRHFDEKETIDSDGVQKLKRAFKELAKARSGVAMWEEALAAGVDAYSRQQSVFLDRLVRALVGVAKELALRIENRELHPSQNKKAKDIGISMLEDAFDVGLERLSPEDSKWANETLKEWLGSEFSEADRMDMAKEAWEDFFGKACPQGFASSDDIFNELKKRMEEDFNAQAQKQASQEERRRASQKKRKGEKPVKAADMACESNIKEIYRKLASALHPDRAGNEKEIELRMGKMQKANRFRDENDFCSLLELAAEEGVLPEGHFSGKSPEILSSYEKAIQKQVREAKTKQTDLAMEASRRFNGWVSKPEAISMLVSEAAALMKKDVEEIEGLRNKASTSNGARALVKSFHR